MELTTRIDLGLAAKFGSKTFFHKFFYGRARDEIADRIRWLREFRALKQSELASLAGMKQSAISRVERADYAGWSFKTLARIAEALDARLVVEFRTREEVIREYEYRNRIRQHKKSALDALQAGDLQEQGISLKARGTVKNEIATNPTRAGGLALGLASTSGASATS